MSKTINTIKNSKLILSDSTVRRFWVNHSPDIVAPVLQEMDSKETWTSKIMKDDNVISLLREFTRLIASIKTITDKDVYNKHDDILTLLAYMNSSWAFRFLKWLDDYRNPVLMKLTLSATTNANQISSIDRAYITPSELYIDRMIALKQLSLLAHVFSEERSAVIDNIINIKEEESYQDL